MSAYITYFGKVAENRHKSAKRQDSMFGVSKVLVGSRYGSSGCVHCYRENELGFEGRNVGKEVQLLKIKIGSQMQGLVRRRSDFMNRMGFLLP